MTDPTPLPPEFLTLPLAHRGLHDAEAGRVENGTMAVAAAVTAGYGIEIDVRLSCDDETVVFHDATLERLSGRKGRVAELTAAELAEVSLAGGAERIPTLSAVLTQVAGRVPLLIELKDTTGELGESDGRLETAVATVLAGYAGPVAVMSFNPHMVGRLARLAPGLPRGLATDAFRPEDWPGVPPERLDRLRRIDVEEVGASFVSHDRRELDSPPLVELAAAGLPILTWTIRSSEQEEAARRVARNITFEGYLPSLPPDVAPA